VFFLWFSDFGFYYFLISFLGGVLSPHQRASLAGKASVGATTGVAEGRQGSTVG
jgi:hypothetical protein